jgi:hypothetical protein
MPGHSLILLSCSRNKRPGGVLLDPWIRCLSSSSSLHRVVGDFVAVRRTIFDLLHGKNGRLYDEDQKGGFRDERRVNRDLFLGPEFGGRATGYSSYMPAYRRYAGRFFETIDAIAPNFWTELREEPVDVLFVSGLYGLVFWDEPIQNYDCHLNDYAIMADGRPSVGEIWRSAFTNVLSDFVKNQAALGSPVRYVYDLLSEEIYQDIFDWEKIGGRNVTIHHRIFQGLAGPDILSWVARILGKNLGRFSEADDRFQNDVWAECQSDTRTASSSVLKRN